MDITLDNVLTILDEYYNNVKVLDALNQELLQLQMADKETISDWGICLSRHLQVLATSCFQNASLLTMWLSWNVTTFMVGYPNILKPWWPTSRPAHRKGTYSNYLWVTREAEKEDSRELSQSPLSQATDNTVKLKVTSFFLLQKLKGTQPTLKTPAMCLVHLEKESAKKDEEVESKDPNSINGVMEEFMVHLTRAMKDTQMEEKCCYHCSSLEDFICNCPLVKSLGAKSCLNCKEGAVLEKGAQAPQAKATMPQTLQAETPKV